MLHKIGFLISGIVLFTSCGSNTSAEKPQEVKKDSVNIPSSKCEILFNEAKAADDILLRANVINKDVAEKAILAFNHFVTNCAEDSLAPVFLLKAGQVAQSINKYSQAQEFFVKCKNQFPEFKNRGAAMFLLAQLYDDANKLNNESEAKIIYEQIIKEYPKSPFAADSKACIRNLGKSDEELIKEFTH